MKTDGNVERLRSELDVLHKSRNNIDRCIERKKLLILKALPGSHGFESMDAFIRTLAQFASQEMRDRIGAATEVLRGGGRGRRYPAELRVAVRNALEAGDSASEIARANGMSLATIIRWNKVWGVKSRRGGGLRRARPRPAEKVGNSETALGAAQNGESRGASL